ncbi:tetratricopeptide repeat protein [Lactobacillus sp. UCMA15818]|uniref:tetratricopeptide repeat protein n=1 Tax=Lactobacillaceae TaxID=33958 RepID=UPI0025AFDBF9|nr:tetratricopeptide repeat protein [Lactobacillus sp. UCMA15818]MDN2453900.1 tetratricopeptide repeat protein [Lactobacillus sp. UCMA15818]
MKTRLKKTFWGVSLTLLAIVAVGCSAGNSNNSSSSSSMTTKQVKSHYTEALKYLDKGTPQQAYSELEKVIAKNAENKKIKVLYNNLGRLLSAKRAVTENKLAKAKKKLQQLAKVKEPDKLVKQIDVVQREYQAVKLAKIYYNETVAYYNAGKYSEAGGSYQTLMALSSKYQAVASYQEKAKSYQQKIAAAQNQSTASQAESTSQATTTSGYTNARSSKIVSSTYASQTGSSISSATNSQVSSVVAGLSDSQILTKFRAVTGLPQEAGDQYYVMKLDDDTYQIEIRHTSPDNVDVSNLKGMYKYNYTTGKVQKADEITGEYTNIN